MRVAEPCSARVHRRGYPTMNMPASMTSVTNPRRDARRSRPIYIKTDYEVGHAYYRRVLVQGRALSNQRHTNCYTRVLVPAVSIFGSGQCYGQYLLLKQRGLMFG